MKAENRRRSQRGSFSGNHLFVCPGLCRGISPTPPEVEECAKKLPQHTKIRRIQNHAAALFSSKHQKNRRTNMLV